MKSASKRICILFIAAIFAAITLSFGCGHENFGPFDEFTDPDDLGSGKDTRVINATLTITGPHSMDLTFDVPMNTTTVELRISDDAGTDVENLATSWSFDRKILHIGGAFAFCRTYTVKVLVGSEDAYSKVLEEDLVFEADMSGNPLDVDQSASCTADPVVSPLFTDGPDGFLITGDTISRYNVLEEFRRTDINKINKFYIDESAYYGDADRMIIVPAMSANGSAGLAKLFYDSTPLETNYMLGLWHVFDPVNEEMTSSIIYDIQAGIGRTLKGPFNAGDLNGDGINEIMLSNEVSLGGGSLLQDTYILRGPITYGDNLPLTDVAGTSERMGLVGEAIKPFFSVGDINGDGKDDIAAIRYRPLSYGRSTDWKLWLLYGDADIEQVLALAKSDIISGYPGRIMVDADAGDVNGDGKSDIIIAEMERYYSIGTYKNVKPHVGIFFGGHEMIDLSMVVPDSELYFKTSLANNATLNMRVLGDINGDGKDDIGVYVKETDIYQRVVSSKIYIFMGRELWLDRYTLTSSATHANIIIDVSGQNNLYWKDDVHDPMIGDIDNDGCYDFMIMTETATENTVYWFFGRNGYSTAGWKLDLTDADTKWIFRTQ